MLTVTVAATALAQSTDSFLIGPSPTLGQYIENSLLGQNPILPGWTGAWADGFQGGALKATGTGLTYPNLPSAGGAATIAAADSGRAGRLLETTYDSSSDDTVYMSLLMQADVDSGGNFTYGGFELHNGGFGDGGQRFLQIVQGENQGSGTPQVHDWQLTAGTNDSGKKVHVNLGTNDQLVNLFVLRLNLSSASESDSVTLYQNPDLSSLVEPGTADASITGVDIQFDRTSFARFGDNGPLFFDELRIADTYADVVSSVFVPEITLGDTDGNGIVEFEPDFGPIRDNWLETDASFQASLGRDLIREDGDLNFDGSVDIFDFREWKNAFNGPAELVAQAYASLGATAVPEPTSITLALVAGLGLALAVRQKR
jgi:hypothetical protein